MSSSEIGFLVLGLGLGGATGAALLAAVRSRRGARPAVRVTITPNAIPPRSARPLAGVPVSLRRTPVPGSPEDDAWRDAIPIAVASAADAATTPLDGRTRVLSAPLGLPVGAVGIPILGGPAMRLPAPVAIPVVGAAVAPVAALASRGHGAPSAAMASTSGLAVAIAPPWAAPVAMAESRTRLDVGGSTTALAVRPRPPVLDPRPRIGASSVAIPIMAAGTRRRTAGSPRPASRAPEAAADACADDRRAAATRCAAADTARDAGRDAADLLREAQRAHAALQARVEEAGATGDPRRVAAEKDRLHEEFKGAHDRAADADEAEAAARAWLTAVSELNARARDAVHRIQAGTAELRTRTAELDRLDREAEAARIAADHAEAECRSAREELAQCEERQQAARPVAPPAGERQFSEHWPGEDEPAFDRRPTDPVDLERMPAVIRILRGDAAARESVVAALAGDDPAARPAWQVRIARLMDAIAARAIEDGYLDLPPDHPFWGLFNTLERRDIVGALSSLGFRYDGLQGFADEREPSARDLSLAVGYAGLDRMRIRTWPGPADLAGLYAEAVVAADLWLAHQADDLALGRVVDALGTRGEGLAEVWDTWGRVRPALLADL